jgi:hypothetical protein
MRNLKFYYLLLTTCILSCIQIFSQQCGGFYKPLDSSSWMGEDENIVIRDRFGNQYSIRNIGILVQNSEGNNPPYPSSLPVQTTPPPCQAGMFTLHFAPDVANFGFDVSANRDVLCQVFKDVSRLLYDVNPSNSGRVHIWVASDRSFSSLGNWQPSTSGGSIIALASPFQAKPIGLSHTLLDNEVGKTIKGGNNSYLYLPYNLEPYGSDGILIGIMTTRKTKLIIPPNTIYIPSHCTKLCICWVFHLLSRYSENLELVIGSIILSINFTPKVRVHLIKL